MLSLLNSIRRLFKFQAELTILERTILNAVQKKLRPQDAELWGKQVAAINKIYRSPDGKEMAMYVISRGRSEFPKVLCFSNLSEFKIAVVDLASKDGGAKLRGRVWCVNGHVFSIEYNKSCKDFERNAFSEWCISCHIEMQPFETSVASISEA